MRAMLIAGAASLAGGGAYASGAIGSGEYYAMAPAQVSARLADMPLPDKLTEADPEGQLQLITIHATEQKVNWQLLLAGNKLADVDADLVPTWSGGTRVSIDFRPRPEGELNQQLASALPLDDDFLDSVIEMSIGEQADAYLENRPFDENKLKFAVAGYAATHPDKLKAFSQRVQKMAAEPPSPDTWRDAAASESGPDPEFGKAAPARGTPAEPESDSGWDSGEY
jgi:hypothetical protein